MLQYYETVCKGFGENPQRIEPQEFFKYFSDFFLQVGNVDYSLLRRWDQGIVFSYPGIISEYLHLNIEINLFVI